MNSLPNTKNYNRRSPEDYLAADTMTECREARVIHSTKGERGATWLMLFQYQNYSCKNLGVVGRLTQSGQPQQPMAREDQRACMIDSVRVFVCLPLSKINNKNNNKFNLYNAFSHHQKLTQILEKK